METIYFVRVTKGENGIDTYTHHSITGEVKSTDVEADGNEQYDEGTHFYAPYQASFTTIRVLAGKVLTLLDASIDDKNKLKAMKDCVRTSVIDAHCQNSDTHYPRPPAFPDDETLIDEISVEDVEKEACGQ